MFVGTKTRNGTYLREEIKKKKKNNISKRDYITLYDISYGFLMCFGKEEKDVCFTPEYFVATTHYSKL